MIVAFNTVNTHQTSTTLKKKQKNVLSLWLGGGNKSRKKVKECLQVSAKEIPNKYQDSTNVLKKTVMKT